MDDAQQKIDYMLFCEIRDTADATWYEYRVAVAVFFGEHSKNHSQKKRRPLKYSENDRKTVEIDAGRLPSMAHARIQLEAQTPFRSLPQVVS